MLTETEMETVTAWLSEHDYDSDTHAYGIDALTVDVHIWRAMDRRIGATISIETVAEFEDFIARPAPSAWRAREAETMIRQMERTSGEIADLLRLIIACNEPMEAGALATDAFEKLSAIRDSVNADWSRMSAARLDAMRDADGETDDCFSVTQAGARHAKPDWECRSPYYAERLIGAAREHAEAWERARV